MCNFSEDDIQVDIIFPEIYVAYNTTTMSTYASAISHLCKAAALLRQNETEFTIPGMTILQVISIENVMSKFGVQMAHEHIIEPDGTRYTKFLADVRGLQQIIEETNQ